MKSFLLAVLLLLGLSGCTVVQGKLSQGMTPEQAIDQMGQPSRKESIADPEKGGELLRYVWSDGRAATFGHDNHLIRIDQLQAEQSAAAGNFDPVSTPLSYVFYPIKAGLTWFGSALNCVAENSCHPPPPSAGPG